MGVGVKNVIMEVFKDEDFMVCEVVFDLVMWMKIVLESNVVELFLKFELW